MKLLIGLTGKARTGKDYLGAKLAEVLSFPSHAFAADLKDIYCAGHEISRVELEADKETHRQGLIDLSEKHLKKYDGAFFAKRFLDKIAMPEYKFNHWIITDFRYQAEYEHLRDQTDIFLFLIRVEDEQHSIENCGYALEKANVDYTFYNDHDPQVFELRFQKLISHLQGFIDGFCCAASCDAASFESDYVQ